MLIRESQCGSETPGDAAERTFANAAAFPSLLPAIILGNLWHSKLALPTYIQLTLISIIRMTIT